MRARLDFPFTERDDAAARAVVADHLERIVARVAAADPRLRALLLTGGFSRGEGTVHNGKPVNDYDLVAVRSRPGGGARYRALHETLSREVGIEVDLLPVWVSRLPRVGAKLFWLDLQLGGRVIAGDDTTLARLPARSARDLPRSEVARLLGNRAVGLLLALPASGEAAKPTLRDLQATKAILAALDGTLLARGEYAPKLRGRLALVADHPDAKLFAQAVEWKLGEGAAMGDWWWEAARDVLLRAVDSTGARACRDGTVERAYHLLRARRVAASPSQDIRLRAWDLLRETRFPQGPPDWAREKSALFAARARTLQ